MEISSAALLIDRLFTHLTATFLAYHLQPSQLFLYAFFKSKSFIYLIIPFWDLSLSLFVQTVSHFTAKFFLLLSQSPNSFIFEI